ncbi:MAG: type I methionyl aminopeptidase [Patescibacteria group bacterium]|nr:type I methionyl aminopeptidase [Patescibacteria group bacterium]
MIYIKTKQEIDIIREGGKILSSILNNVISHAKAGAKICDLDKMAEELILKKGGVPSFKNYGGDGKNSLGFPSTMCISINNEVVHGSGKRKIILQTGDIVDFDIGMRYPAKGGLYTDMSKTIGVGKISKIAQKLIKVTKKSLALGIEQIKEGNRIIDIARAIQNHAENAGFSVVRDLTGHGVGKEVHEDPKIPNYVDNHFGKIELKQGMVIAIEPMINVGKYKIKTLNDGWTVATADNSLSAHFEHTVAVTKTGYEILTI